MSTIRAYKFVEKIGMDGNSEIMLYTDKKTKQKHFIKQINMSVVSDVERLGVIIESYLLKHLLHPNVICSPGSFYHGNNYSTVTDYTDSDLYSVIQARTISKDPFTELEVMYYFVQILFALSYIHEQKITHGNICSQSVNLNKFQSNEGQKYKYQVKLDRFQMAQIFSPQKMADPIVELSIAEDFRVLKHKLMTGEQKEKMQMEFKLKAKEDIMALGKLLCDMCTLQTEQLDKPHIDTKWFSQGLSDLIDEMTQPPFIPSAKELLELPFVKDWMAILVQKKMIDKEQLETNENEQTQKQD
ncbi:Kinase [Hexamita inflata]|uniref:non-specific serine/threonine protein kinase n=1 Tax=Hexamita inflata TaxID=28002 RepID=A0AA86QQ21_9EUKA|nr:Kinase [Hexamita inflata]